MNTLVANRKDVTLNLPDFVHLVEKQTNTLYFETKTCVPKDICLSIDSQLSCQVSCLCVM